MKNSSLVCVLFCASASAANSNDSAVSFTGQASLGGLHNSSLVVAELDKVAAQADNALSANVKLQGKWQASDKLKAQANYQYSRKDYQELNDYDLDIHQFGLDVEYDFTAFSLGVRHDLAKASLAGDDFLQLNLTSLYVAKFLKPDLYVRGALNFKDKKFAQIAQRDADNQGVNLSVFQFFQGGKTMLSVGLSAEQEQAADAQFDYDNWGVNTKVSHKFDLLGQENKLQFGWRYQTSDYQAQGNAAARADTLINYEAQWQVSVYKQVNLVTKLEHGISQSTLENLNYQQNVASVQVEVNF